MNTRNMLYFKKCLSNIFLFYISENIVSLGTCYIRRLGAGVAHLFSYSMYIVDEWFY